jgi:type IV pilus assembly protein PilA
MKMNKKGFTLVELLAVIVILAVILVIAIPNVLSIIDKSRKDSTVSTAKMMVKAAQLKIANGDFAAPSLAKSTLAKMSALGLDNVTKDADGGSYTDATSYVLISNESGVIKYAVQIVGSKRWILLTSTLATIDSSSVVATGTPVAAQAVSGTYASGSYGLTALTTVETVY